MFHQMATSEQIQIVLNAKNNTSKAFADAEKGVGALNGAIKNITAIGVPAMAVALGKKAVDAAAKFETQMGNLKTLIGEDTEQVAKFEKGLKDMQKTIPKTGEDLGAAAYQIVSAGISDATEAMNVLREAGELAVAGLGETAEAVDIMTSAINAYGMKASEAEHVANTFFMAVANGKTTVAQLAQGFGTVAPLASTLGVSFEDLMATTSAMTKSGLAASVAYTQIKAVLSSLLKPSTDMKNIFSSIGISSEELKSILSEEGLTGTVRMLSEAVDGDQQKLASMFGSVEALNAVMMLLNETGDNAIEVQKNMTESTGALDEAFKIQNETYASQVQKLKGELNVALINLGNIIMPALLAIMKIVNGYLQNSFIPALKITGQFFGSMGDSIKFVIDLLGSFIKKMGEAIAIAAKFVVGGPVAGVKAIAGAVSGKAVGGSVNANTPYLVGERGAELFVPSSSGSIIANNRLAGAGGGITLNISGNSFLDESAAEKFGDKIIAILKKEIRMQIR